MEVTQMRDLNASGLNLYVNGCLTKAGYQEWSFLNLMQYLSAFLAVDKAQNKIQSAKSILKRHEAKARKEGSTSFILPIILRYPFMGIMKFDFEIILETEEYAENEKSVKNGRGCSLFLNGKHVGKHSTFVDLYKSMKQELKVLSWSAENKIEMPQGAAIAIYRELIRNGSMLIPNDKENFFFNITKA